MFQEAYKKQVALLLTVLPEVAKEPCFALYGGTAINLFIRNMPRLSVDIDLINVPVEERASSFANISAALERIKSHIETIIPGARVVHRKDAGKLQISAHGTSDTFQLSPGNCRISRGSKIRTLKNLPHNMKRSGTSSANFEARASLLTAISHRFF